MTTVFSNQSFELIITVILAVLFTIAGVVNLAGPDAVKEDFERWGCPRWFRLLCGFLELLTAVFLLGRQTKALGLILAGAIMIGALFTLLRNQEPFKHLAPALVFSALVVIAAAVSA